MQLFQTLDIPLGGCLARLLGFVAKTKNSRDTVLEGIFTVRNVVVAAAAACHKTSCSDCAGRASRVTGDRGVKAGLFLVVVVVEEEQEENET